MKTNAEGIETPEDFNDKKPDQQLEIVEEKNVELVSEQAQVQSILPTSVFAGKDVFEHNQRVATMLSKSALVPKDYQGNNGIANCMIALEMSTRMGASPLMVMQNLYIVHGRPAWSSQFLIATMNATGRFTAIRYEENEEKGGSCRAYATDKQTGEVCYGVWVNMEMAKAEGWSTKNGSKWITMPQLMRRYRSAAFFTRQFAPEVSMGIMTQEEAIDVTPPKPQIPEGEITITKAN